MFESRLFPSPLPSFRFVPGTTAHQPGVLARHDGKSHSQGASFRRNASLLMLVSCFLLAGFTAQAQTASISALTCATGSFTGAGTDACTATLTAAAPDSGMTLNLSSSDVHVTVPSSVTVAGGATTATFTATVQAIFAAQTATLTVGAEGVQKTYAINLNPPLPSALTCANGSYTGAGTDLCTATLTAGAPASGMMLNLSSNDAHVTVPSSVTVAGGATTATFTAAVSSIFTAQTATLTVGAEGVQETYAINLIPPALSSLTCASGSITGATTDACTVTLTGATSSSMTLSLVSSDSAVTVPASVTVPSGSAAAAFTATAAAVTTAQTATITASGSAGSANIALQLNAWEPTLSFNSSSIGFGSVNLNSPATQTLVLNSVGTAPLTVSASSLTGSGFSISGASLPLTLPAGQSATLEVTFTPTAAGTASGSLAITSNCSMGPGPMTVSLSGTGVQPLYSVNLSWDAPGAPSSPVTGYNIYRSVSGGAFQLLSSSVTPTSFTDNTVNDGTTYIYQVTSVDEAGTESGPSNTYTAVIP
jgi:Abnormal spindle-like microcephaly-assoc'd, ASPM-SPD-2-Hydin